MRLIINPVNGILNRLRSIACSKILAEYCERDFYVSWVPEPSCNVTLSDLLKPETFHITPVPEIDDSFYVHKGYERGAEQPFVNEMVSSKKESVYLVAGGNFKPDEMPIKKFNSKKSAFYRSLDFTDYIRDSVEMFLKENESFSGIHIRMTDREFFAPTIQTIESTIDSISGKVFVCSDNLEIKNLLIQSFGNKTISYSTQSTNRSDKSAILDAMIEWLILSNSKQIYCSPGSSFSYEACYPKKISNPVIMESRNWGAFERDQHQDKRFKLEF